jgi:hypothetical protein
MLALILVIAGCLLRFVPHAPNFTPVAAIALLSGAYMSRRRALTVALLVMMISDLFIGTHNVMLFTWAGFAVIALLGSSIKTRFSWLGLISTSLVSSITFYLISNFGVWVMGWYPHTLKGLINCYIMALPFLRNFTLATLIYTLALFGLYELAAGFIKNTKLSKVLLNAF